MAYQKKGVLLMLTKFLSLPKTIKRKRRKRKHTDQISKVSEV